MFIEILPIAYAKMQAVVAKISTEVGWLGATSEKNGVITIHDIVVPEQEASGGTCELLPTGIAKALAKFKDMGYTPDVVRLWGHSHAGMCTNPSGQDDTQGYDRAKNFTGISNHYVRQIMNKRGEMHMTVYLPYWDVKVEKVDWTVTYPGVDAGFLSEVEAAVKEFKYVAPQTTTGPSAWESYQRQQQTWGKEQTNLPAKDKEHYTAPKNDEVRIFNGRPFVYSDKARGWLPIITTEKKKSERTEEGTQGSKNQALIVPRSNSLHHNEYDPELTEEDNKWLQDFYAREGY